MKDSVRIVVVGDGKSFFLRALFYAKCRFLETLGALVLLTAIMGVLEPSVQRDMLASVRILTFFVCVCARFLFCIAAKVGKTSIIEVLITENFEEDVQPVLPVLVVPKEVTPERVHVSIVDTPGDPSLVAKVDEELGQADVIVLVYSVDSDESSGRIPSYWLPKFREQNLNVPIILVGNKIDTRGGISDPSASAKMEAFIKPIMDKFREVDVCIECSAKTVSNISEVFYFAQKAVLYPTGPVYDVEKQALKPAAAAALRRIFKICDKDGDGGLNDKELNDFQHTCFNVYLQQKELEGVKKVVQESRPNGGLNRDGSLSTTGFIFLHTLFVQKGRLETTWIVLRKFGYDDEMRLSVAPNDKLVVADDQSVELSVKGKRFLGELFAAADKDTDGMLSPAELKALFADCPEGAFATKEKKTGTCWTQQAEEAGKTDYMTLDAFMARWTMYVLDHADDATLTLLFLGYQDPLPSAFKVTKPRRRDRYSKTVSREVFNIAVLGSEGASKSDIIRGLVDMPGCSADEPHACAAADKVDTDGERKTLVMRHVPESDMEKLFSSKAALEKIDITCLVFDASSQDSYEKSRLIYQALESKKPAIRMPVVFVACMRAGSNVEGAGVLEQADEFCMEQVLPTPVRVSPKDGEFANLYEDLLGVAQYPQVACPDYYGSGDGPSTAAKVVKVVAGVVVVGGLAYGAKRLYDYYASRPSSF